MISSDRSTMGQIKEETGLCLMYKVECPITMAITAGLRLASIFLTFCGVFVTIAHDFGGRLMDNTDD